MVINYRFLIWMLKKRMVHHQFPLVLQHCKLNLPVFLMVLLQSFLYRVHDDDDFDVLHLMPIKIKFTQECPTAQKERERNKKIIIKYMTQFFLYSKTRKIKRINKISMLARARKNKFEATHFRVIHLTVIVCIELNTAKKREHKNKNENRESERKKNGTRNPNIQTNI